MANIEELAKVEPPKIPKSGSIGFQEALGIQQPYMQRKAEIQSEIGKVSGEEALAKQQQQTGLAEAKAGVQEAKAGAEKAARAGYEEKLAEEPLPEFIPTKDTVQDIAGLFGLIGVIGMIAGKGDAMKAMNAMNGMLAGHREGRLELYRQERDTFEKNFRAMLKKHEEFRKEMEDAIKTAATDAEAGMAKAELAATKAGSEIVKAQLRKGDLMGAYKLVEESGKGAQNALATEQKMREAAANRAAAMQRTQMQISAADERARLAREAKQKPSGELPKDKETNNEHRFRHSAMVTVQEVLDDLQNPEIRRLIGPQNQYMPDVILNLQDKYPALAQKLARFQSEEFKIGGKALTASEQKILGPIYNWRGLTAKALEDNLKEAERTMDKEQRYLENRYPGLKAFDYEGGAGAVRDFTSIEEAEAAGLAPGTRIKINGRPAVVE